MDYSEIIRVALGAVSRAPGWVHAVTVIVTAFIAMTAWRSTKRSGLATITWVLGWLAAYGVVFVTTLAKMSEAESHGGLGISDMASCTLSPADWMMDFTGTDGLLNTILTIPAAFFLAITYRSFQNVVAYGVAGVVAIEAFQGITDVGGCSGGDIAANGLGVIIGAAAGFAWTRLTQSKALATDKAPLQTLR